MDGLFMSVLIAQLLSCFLHNFQTTTFWTSVVKCRIQRCRISYPFSPLARMQFIGPEQGLSHGIRCMVCEQDVQLNDHPYCGHAWIPEANRYITHCEESPPGFPEWNRCFKTIYEELENGDTYYVRECGLGSAMTLDLGCNRWIERGYGFDVELCVCEGDLCNRDITYRERSLSKQVFSKTDLWLLLCLSGILIVLLRY